MALKADLEKEVKKKRGQPWLGESRAPTEQPNSC